LKEKDGVIFRDWRYIGVEPNQDFVMNNASICGSILWEVKNFGSGSSRDHAAWAIYDRI
jgi:3-isopropylmalate/(R)-2-methylmalate dehydratase small subunit